MMIRSATLDDLDALVPLFDAYRVFYEKPSDVAGARAFLHTRITHNESTIYIAENEGVLAGFVQLYPLFSSTRMQRLWLLNDLFVAPEWRGQGLSVALIDAAKALCAETNACGLMLETAKSNGIGNQLYPRTGFVADEEHHYYYWYTGQMKS